MPRILMPITHGVEEMEAVTIIDTLRRADWDVVVAGIPDTQIHASRGVSLTADTLWSAVTLSDFDAMVIPGGTDQALSLVENTSVLDAVRHFADRGKMVAAICAAPLILERAGVLKGRKATAYPSVLDQLKSAQQSEDRVVIDGTIMTSRGPGTALEFALALIREMQGPGAAQAVAAPMLVPEGAL